MEGVFRALGALISQLSSYFSGAPSPFVKRFGNNHFFELFSKLKAFHSSSHPHGIFEITSSSTSLSLDSK
jgi:hypothetical protein